MFGTFLILSLKLMQWYVTSVSRGYLYEKFGNKCVKILKFRRTELSYAQNKNRGKKMRLLGMDTCPSLNDIMEIRRNKCIRSEQGYDYNLMLTSNCMCRPYINTNNPQGMQLGRFKNRTPARFEYIYCALFFCRYSLLLYLNFWNFSDPIVEVNAVVRHFRHPWVLIRKIWQ
jgi:hypothetical protein